MTGVTILSRGGTGEASSGGGTAASVAANTGSGGNAGKGGGGIASAGASGIVVVRYNSTVPAATSTTGSPTVTISGEYRYYTFNSSGSITF
jgi:hypothetical protein